LFLVVQRIPYYSLLTSLFLLKRAHYLILVPYLNKSDLVENPRLIDETASAILAAARARVERVVAGELRSETPLRVFVRSLPESGPH
jgi:hypothetical protein